MEPFLSHLVRLILSNIIVILGCSYIGCIDSHIIVSMEYMLDLLYITMELFLGYQDRPDAPIIILGYISFI